MPVEQHIIRRRLGWTHLPEITVEITCEADASSSMRLGLAVRAAWKSRANLSGADLSGANLSEADLSGADLSGANLSGAYLSRANLSGADLSGADLSGAYLSRANLSGADLSGADLSGANLSRANLSGADLSGANLSGANLSRANLSEAYLSEEALRPFKADLWATLIGLKAAPVEIGHLIYKLRSGEVDGSTYGDPGTTCACLVGTLAQPREVSGEELDHDSGRPAERWFMMISPGDKPDATGEDGKPTGGAFAATKALQWLDELCACLGFDPEPFAIAAPAQAEAA